MLPMPIPPTPRPKRTQQRGIAILTVLVIAVLIVTLAAAIFARQSYALRQTDNFHSLERAWQYVFTMEQFAALQLQLDAKTNRFDALTDRWAIPLPTQTLKEASGAVVKFSGKLEDQHSRFNLNNLIHPDGELRGKLDGAAQNQLKNFVTDAGLPVGFTNVLTDWVDSNNLPEGMEGAERDYYLAGAIPYLAADMPLVDLSEVYLLRLDNLEPQQKDQALKQFFSMVTVLPFKKSTINPNTASPAVLKAMRLSNEQINQILTKRRLKQAYKSKEEFQRDMALTPDKDALLINSFDVVSQYFRLSGEVEINRARVFVNSLLLREANGSVRVIMRQFEHATELANTPNKTTATDVSHTPANTNRP